MHRTEGDGFVVDGVTGKNRFDPGDPLIPTPATMVTYDWANAVQEELSLTIEGLGGTLNTAATDTTPNQLLTRLNAKYGRLDLANTWAGNQSIGGTLGVTGNVAVNTDAMVVDATNKRVGINTTGPNCRLAIGHAGVANANVPVQINAGSTTEMYYAANKGGALGLLWGYSNGGGFGTKGVIANFTSDNIGFYINGLSNPVCDMKTTGIEMTAANPASTTAFSNTLTAANIVKAWAMITTNGAGGVSVNAGFNVAGVSLSGSRVVVEFAQDFASANYAITVTGETEETFSVYAKAAGSATIQMHFLSWDTIEARMDLGPLNTVPRTFYITAIGAQ